MATDRVPLPTIVGIVESFVGTPLPVASVTVATVISEMQVSCTDPGTGGVSAVFRLSTSTNPLDTPYVECQLAPGARLSTPVVGAAITTGVGDTIYLHVANGIPDMLNASGFYVVGTVGAAVPTLTTLALVKQDLGITSADADRDALLQNIIDGVSVRMQTWMNRNIVETTTTDEYIDSIGQPELTLQGFPITTMTSVDEHSTALTEGDDYRVNASAGVLTRTNGSGIMGWGRGIQAIRATYAHGYATVPNDLVRAATAQSAQDFHETQASGKGWRGLSSKGVDPSAPIVFDKDFWSRETVAVMRPYRRINP
jgi:hypothetical protein